MTNFEVKTKSRRRDEKTIMVQCSYFMLNAVNNTKRVCLIYCNNIHYHFGTYLTSGWAIQLVEMSVTINYLYVL